MRRADPRSFAGAVSAAHSQRRRRCTRYCADDEILEQAGVDDPMDLFGFYTGIPLTERTADYGLVPPGCDLYFPATDRSGLQQ